MTRRPAYVPLIFLVIISFAIAIITLSSQNKSIAKDQAYEIMPPGNNGFINSLQTSEYLKTHSIPSNTFDQIAPYENLLYSGSLNNSNISNYFIPEILGSNNYHIVSRQKLLNDKVTISWDNHGIPHILGNSLESMAYGAGFAVASQRLFEIDVIRNYARGTLARFVGPSCSLEQMDLNQLEYAPYTTNELKSQINHMKNSYGIVGREIYSMALNYLKGINAYVYKANHNSNFLPEVYTLLGEKPHYFSPEDLVAMTSLIGSFFGTGGGGQLQNSTFLQDLENHYGTLSRALEVFNAFKEQNYPGAPTTINSYFRYMRDSTYSMQNNVMLDKGTYQSILPTNTPDCGSAGPGTKFQNIKATKNAAKYRLVSYELNSLINKILPINATLTLPPTDSNGVVIGAKLSATGHPLAVFGPQVGYGAPSLLYQEDLQAPGYEASGVAFAGLSFIIQIGRGTDYAWSATTASPDMTDTKVVPLCNPNGGSPSSFSAFYIVNNKCIPMKDDVFSYVANPTVASGGKSALINYNIYITKYGVVQGIASANGRLVAIVKDRSTYGNEISSAIGLFEMGQPSIGSSAKNWLTAASKIDFGFNWMYLNSHSIAYFESGLDPIRPPTYNPNFLAWANNATNWQGYLGVGSHPQAINPPNQMIISWNNKPAPGFSAADNQWGYGPVYRSQLLINQVENELMIHGGKIDLFELIKAVENAATQDLTAVADLGLLLPLITPSNNTQKKMKQLLADWFISGSHRVRPNPNANNYKDTQAIAISDTFFPLVERDIFSSVIGFKGINTQNSLPTGFSDFPMAFVNPPNPMGDAYDGGFEGYLKIALMELIGKYNSITPFPKLVNASLCSSGITSCKAVINADFSQTQNILSQINKTQNPYNFLNDPQSIQAHETIAESEDIAFEQIGFLSYPKMPWQNRPTFQQAVTFVN